MSVQISARARQDLEHIYAVICARQGSDAADQFLQSAREAVSLLSNHPGAGPHPQWSLRHKQIRFSVISRTNFIIYYFADENSFSIERILDGRRDVKRIIDLREEDAENNGDSD